MAANGGTSVDNRHRGRACGNLRARRHRGVFFHRPRATSRRRARPRTAWPVSTFMADSRSGIAHASGFLRGPGAAPSPSPSATPATLDQRRGRVGALGFDAAAAVHVKHRRADIGDGDHGRRANPSVIVSANPPRITEPRNTPRSRANVFDASGNPVADVPVFFSDHAASRWKRCCRSARQWRSAALHRHATGKRATHCGRARIAPTHRSTVTVTATLPRLPGGSRDRRPSTDADRSCSFSSGRGRGRTRRRRSPSSRTARP